MKIILDASAFYHGTAGISVYTRGLISGLAEIDADNEYVLYGGRGGFGARSMESMIFCPPLRNFSRKVSRWPLRGSFMLNRLPVEFFAGAADIYHGTSFLLPKVLNARSVVTIHDLSFEINIDWYPEVYKPWRESVRRSALAADRIIAASQNTKKDITDIYGISPENIDVVYLAPPSTGEMPRECDIEKKYGLPPIFILAVGRIEKRKNLTAVLSAMSILKRGGVSCNLVVVGADGYGSDEFYREADSRGLSGEIITCKNVPTVELSCFYRAARLLVFPSLYEGFGLPVLEAMSYGCPVVVSGSSSLPEVAQDAGITVNPASAEDVAAAIAALLSDDNLRADRIAAGRARAAGFTWAQTARRSIDTYKTALSR
ncbi:MAG: glycosyltransferase family 1 protein [Endomicrobiia bacterium]|nr:glycosyltransferase family 1 protein [Endomicrobiia bacterium]